MKHLKKTIGILYCSRLTTAFQLILIFEVLL